MGDPKKIRKKYDTPTHPWQKDRIEEEIVLKREYGLTNKREIWIVASKLKNFKNQFKKLHTMKGAQADKETEQLRTKLLSLGLLKHDSALDTFLGLETKDLMERRLQTVVFRKNLARSIKQARQFIVHRHILVGGKKITAPSYLVKVGEEDLISFVQASALSDPGHPERYQETPKDTAVKTQVKKKKEEEQIASFEEVPKDEQEILTEMDEKKKEPEEKEIEKEDVKEEKKEETPKEDGEKVTEEKKKEEKVEEKVKKKKEVEKEK